jgi:nucleoside transporter
MNHPALTLRLSIMMFVQFFIWGAWYVTAPRYLGTIGFGGADFAWTYSVGPIAAIISPFMVGMIADRFFATERVLGIMHLLSGVTMFGAAALMRVAQPDPDAINFMFFLHALCYFPTLALVNSLAMRNITSTEKQFPLIRVFGTIGWIIAGAALTGFSFSLWKGWWDWGGTIKQFYLAAGAALVLGIYSFTLPHTPPPLRGQKVTARQVLGLDALVLLRSPSYLIFLISAFLICIPLAFYYQLAERTLVQAGIENTAFKMTFGQMSEIFFMLIMPLCFVRLGVKWMLFLGMLAWVIRYGLFAIGAPEAIHWMLLAGVLLHGICYDFFFVTGQIYTDKEAPPTIRAQAQGLLVLFTLGLGMMIGAQIAGRVEAHYTPPETAALNKQAGELQTRIDALEAQGAPATELDALRTEKNALTVEALKAMKWGPIWTIPAVAAGLVMVLFLFVFKEDRRSAVTEGDVAKAAAVEEQP